MAGKKRKIDPSAQRYYAVRAGARPGVYLTWAECQAQTAGFKGAVYKSFLSREDAEAFAAGKKVPSDSTQEPKFYAVAVGNGVGIYSDWEDCSAAIKNVKGPKYKKFETRAEALDFIRANGNDAAQKWLAAEAETSEPPGKKSRTAKAEVVTIEDSPDLVHVYTDGSARSNGRVGAVAGVGVYFGPGDPRNISERLSGPVQTNNRAELTAILRALGQVTVVQGIRVHSDSNYAIKAVTEWYKNWQKNAWKKSTGDAVENNDLIKAIRAKIESRDSVGSKTQFQWVKGHGSDKGNIAADRLAVEGALSRG